MLHVASCWWGEMSSYHSSLKSVVNRHFDVYAYSTVIHLGGVQNSWPTVESCNSKKTALGHLTRTSQKRGTTFWRQKPGTEPGASTPTRKPAITGSWGQPTCQPINLSPSLANSASVPVRMFSTIDKLCTVLYKC